MTIKLAEFQEQVYNLNVEKGWWEVPRTPLEVIALMHTELSEAAEAYRDGNPMSVKIPEFSQAEEEFADTIIRILDAAQHFGLNIEDALQAKFKYNTTRPHRHGRVA